MSTTNEPVVLTTAMIIYDFGLEIQRLRTALSEYVTGCHGCLGSGMQPRGMPCTECVPARRALRAHYATPQAGEEPHG